MAFVSRFCFMCSLRLGCVIVGFLTVIEATFFLGAALKATDSLPFVSDFLNRFGQEINLDSGTFDDLASNPEIFVIAMSVFFACLLCSSILLLCGCFQLKPILMYPFTFFYLIYIVCLFVALLLLLLLVKARGNGLGDLIFYSNLGGFVLLFYLYTWICVVSLIQIINALRARLKSKLKIASKLRRLHQMKKTTKGLHNYASHK